MRRKNEERKLFFIFFSMAPVSPQSDWWDKAKKNFFTRPDTSEGDINKACETLLNRKSGAWDNALRWVIKLLNSVSKLSKSSFVTVF